MIGVSGLKRALGMLEKKMLKRQVRAQNQYRAAVENGANKQKFFKVSGFKS
jgi:pre-60S factor REI1